MKEEIINLRFRLDSYRNVELGTKSVTIYKIRRKLLPYAKAWLGKCLGELGIESPYKKDGERHSVSDIEPTAERSPGFLVDINLWESMNHIEQIDYLREDLGKISEEIKHLSTSGQTREFAIARTNAYNYVCEARFELGFELENIRESSKQL